MKTKTFYLTVAIVCGLFINGYSQAPKNDNSPKTLSDSTNLVTGKMEKKLKEEQKLFVNADWGGGPREINVGLPQAGEWTLMSYIQDGIPMLSEITGAPHPFSLHKMSPMNATFNFYKSGIAPVVAYNGAVVTLDGVTRKGGPKQKGMFRLSGAAHGAISPKFYISGPMSKDKKWRYAAGASYAYDKGLRSTPYDRVDEYGQFVFNIHKYFDKGYFRIGGWANSSYSKGAGASPFIYKEGGKIDNIDGFDVSKDGFLTNADKFHYLDGQTGKLKSMDADAGMELKNAAIDFEIDYKLSKNLTINNKARFLTFEQKTNTSWYLSKPKTVDELKSRFGIGAQTPLNVSYVNGPQIENPETLNNNGLFVEEFYLTGDPYKGQTVADVLELKLKLNAHKIRFGISDAYTWSNPRQTTVGTTFYKEVGNNPRIVNLSTDTKALTDPISGVTSYNPIAFAAENSSTNVFSIYAYDKWNPAKGLSISYGFRLDNTTWKLIKFDTKSNYGVGPDGDPSTSWDNYAQITGDPNKINENTWNWSTGLDIKYKLGKGVSIFLTGSRGFNNYRISDFTQGSVDLDQKNSIVTSMSGIQYYKSRYGFRASLNYSKMKNINKSGSIQLPDWNYPQWVTNFADVKSIGIDTRTYYKPFKGAQIMLSMVYQQPEYEDYRIDNDQGEDYIFDDNMPGGISKVIIDFNPSYKTKKWGTWFSLRYFSKSYTSAANLLEYEERFEAYCGANYNINKNFVVSAQVNNIFNSLGIKGGVASDTYLREGADLSKQYNTIRIAAPANPRKISFSMTYKF